MHAHRIARAMGVPTEAATDEMHQMIDGKLSESEREPGNMGVRFWIRVWIRAKIGLAFGIRIR